MASRTIVIKNNIRCFKSVLQQSLDFLFLVHYTNSMFLQRHFESCSAIFKFVTRSPFSAKALKTQFSHYIFEISNKVILLEITKLLRPFTGRNALKKSRSSDSGVVRERGGKKKGRKDATTLCFSCSDLLAPFPKSDRLQQAGKQKQHATALCACPNSGRHIFSLGIKGSVLFLMFLVHILPFMVTYNYCSSYRNQNTVR